MSTVTVYGASDDLIEVEGVVSEEFNPPLSHETDEDHPSYLAFSDGTVLRVHYDSDGVWRIVRVARGDSRFEKFEPVGDEYTDRVTLHDGDITWCVFGGRFVKARAVKP
jgi:hypothetical protein